MSKKDNWQCPGGHIRSERDRRYLSVANEVVCRRCGQACYRVPYRGQQKKLDARHIPFFLSERGMPAPRDTGEAQRHIDAFDGAALRAQRDRERRDGQPKRTVDDDDDHGIRQ